MATVQCRIDGNALTTPSSYSVRFMAKDAELGVKLLHAKLGIKLSAKPLHAPA